MSETQTLVRPDGRTLGYIDYGPSEGTPVLWCHGGPGSRYEPAAMAAPAAERGFRLIGIDRPGYGLSDPLPGRTIADWVAEALSVADAIRVEQFYAVGCSTGGAYALALAANEQERVLGVIAACSVTDLRWAPGKEMLRLPMNVAIWDADDRDAALVGAQEHIGKDGSKMFQADSPALADLPPVDLAVLQQNDNPDNAANMFTFGVQGYTDDRLADGVGWESFNVDQVRCPVTVLHGAVDSICPVSQAHHTAAIVPNAELRIVPDLGHLSITSEILPTLSAMRDSIEPGVS